MTTTAAPTEDYLAGVTQKTSKAELIDRLEKATEVIREQHRNEASRLRQIEQRVRRTWAGRKWTGGDLMQVIVQGSEDELKEAVEFMADLEDVLPPTLQRLLIGARTLIDQPTEQDLGT